jgi:hypothetical protein
LGGTLRSGLFELGDDPNSTDDDNFVSLVDLSLYNNLIAGGISATIGNLSNLQHLNLSQNRFIGTIPVEIGQLTNVDWMGFSCNNLHGRIPSELGDLAAGQGTGALRVLFLNDNQLDIFEAGSTRTIDDDKIPESINDIAVVFLTRVDDCLPVEFDKTAPDI